MKNRLENLFKYKFYIIMGALLILFLIIFSGMFMVHASSSDTTVSIEDTNQSEIKDEKEEISEIVVDVKGAVNTPGVYRMQSNSYVYQAIEAAGGLLDTADTSVLNLSKHLSDSMVVIIYTKEEVALSKTANEKVKYVEVNIPCVCPDNMNDACIEKNNSDDNANNSKNDDDKLININEATLEELLKLDGIGASKASAIIEYRIQMGSFKKIDDILNVSGIGDALFEKIKDKITI